MWRTSIPRNLLLWLAAALAPAVPATAADYQVFPVTLEAPAEAPAGVVTLSNRSDEPIALQVRVFRWTQEDGRDVLTPTRDVVASPPAATIGARGEQLIRVVRTAPGRPTTEEAYRLIIDEIPTARAEGTLGVQLLLRQSIPVFFGSRAQATPKVDWQTVRSADGWELVAHNTGERRQRLSDLEIKDEAGRLLDKRPGLVGYVLAGSQARWALRDDQAPLSSVRLTAASDTGAFSVVLENPTTQ